MGWVHPTGVPLQQCPAQRPLGSAAHKPRGVPARNTRGTDRPHTQPLLPTAAPAPQPRDPPQLQAAAFSPFPRGSAPTAGTGSSFPPARRGYRSVPPAGRGPGIPVPAAPSATGPSCPGNEAGPSGHRTVSPARRGTTTPNHGVPTPPTSPVGQDGLTIGPHPPVSWDGSHRPQTHERPSPAPSRARRSHTPNQTSVERPAHPSAHWPSPQEGCKKRTGSSPSRLAVAPTADL